MIPYWLKKDYEWGNGTPLEQLEKDFFALALRHYVHYPHDLRIGRENEAALEIVTEQFLRENCSEIEDIEGWSLNVFIEDHVLKTWSFKRPNRKQRRKLLAEFFDRVHMYVYSNRTVIQDYYDHESMLKRFKDSLEERSYED